MKPDLFQKLLASAGQALSNEKVCAAIDWVEQFDKTGHTEGWSPHYVVVIAALRAVLPPEAR